MFDRPMRGVISIVAVCAASLLSGCGRDSGQPDPAASASSAKTADVAVVFHMTGLLLVLPNQADSRIDVLLPVIPPATVTPDVGPHVAWLGFGIASGSTYVSRLCLNDRVYGQTAIRAGICYVDLDRWSLDPFGSGGQPSPPATRLPSGLLNVTRLSGGQHKAHVPMLDGQIRSQLVFLSGAATDSCSLASWTFERVDALENPQQSEQRLLVNVMDWTIRNPQSLKLVFRLKSNPNSSIEVPLPSPGSGNRIELVLAHVPYPDIQDLPPNSVGTPGATEDSAYHFDLYYDLLRVANNPAPIPRPSARRRIPHDPKPQTGTKCSVHITTRAGIPSGITFPRDTAVGTYACMPATGDGP